MNSLFNVNHTLCPLANKLHRKCDNFFNLYIMLIYIYLCLFQVECMYLKMYILTCLYANNYVLNSTELLRKNISVLFFSMQYVCYNV